MNTVRRMLKACREQLRDDFPDYTPAVRNKDVAHLYWALEHLDTMVDRQPDEVTPATFFPLLDNLAMGVPYPKAAWQAACREVV